MGDVCVCDVCVGFYVVLDAIYEVIDFVLEGVFGDVAAVGENGWDFDPVGLAGVTFAGEEFVVADGAFCADEIDVENVGLDTFDAGGYFADASVVEFKDCDGGGVVFVGFEIGAVSACFVLGDFDDFSAHEPSQCVEGVASC